MRRRMISPRNKTSFNFTGNYFIHYFLNMYCLQYIFYIYKIERILQNRGKFACLCVPNATTLYKNSETNFQLMCDFLHRGQC